ncbi:MAG: MBL fold metallo-hydrolase [Pseudomonadota bacterium]
MSLRFTILGCASSGGVPRAGGLGEKGRWGACDPNEPRNTRRRCALLVRKEGQGGTTTCVIDTGPDFRQQMLAANVERIDAAVYTHSHADHLHGIDDLRPFALSARARIKVYMDEATFERAAHAFNYCFQAPPGSSYPPILDRHLITPERLVEVDGDGGTVPFLPIPVQHGDITALGFRVGAAAYIPDVSAIDEAQIRSLHDLDVLIIDALRYRAHGSHFTVEQALELSARIRPKRTILTNMHVDLDYRTLAAELPSTVEPAYDGLEITL